MSTLADAARAVPAAAWTPPAWRRVLGDLPARGPVRVIAFGLPGSGKTTAMLGLLGAAAAHGVEVRWCDAEMSGAALASVLGRSGVSRSLARQIGYARIEGRGGAAQIEGLLAGTSGGVVLIDSLTATDAEPGDFARWAGYCDLLIGIVHVRADGEARGGSRWQHDADGIVRFVRGEGAAADKSRYGADLGAVVPFADLLYSAPADAGRASATARRGHLRPVTGG